MTDIVDRLRKYIHSAHHTPALIREAAAEIERLTAERDALRAVLQELVACADAAGPQIVFTTGYRWHDVIESARAALREK